MGTASLSQSGCVGAFPSASAFRTVSTQPWKRPRRVPPIPRASMHAVEFFQKGPDVAGDAQVHGTVPADLLRLDVRLDELGVFPEDVAEEVEEAEPAPQKENQVGAREGEEGRAGADGEGGLEAEGVGVGDGSPAGIAREDGDAGLLDEDPESLPRIGIPDAASGDDDRGVRRLEHRNDLPGAFGIQRPGLHTAPGPLHVRRIDLRIEDVAGKFQVDRSRPAGQGGPEGQVDELGNPFGQGADPGLLHHRGDDGKLAHVLEVELLHAFQADASRDQDHRGVGEAGVGDPGERVREARTGGRPWRLRVSGSSAPRPRP